MCHAAKVNTVKSIWIELLFIKNPLEASFGHCRTSRGGHMHTGRNMPNGSVHPRSTIRTVRGTCRIHYDSPAGYQLHPNGDGWIAFVLPWSDKTSNTLQRTRTTTS